MTSDELAQRAPASGRQDEAGLAAQRQSVSVDPVDSSVVDASMEDPPLVRGDDDDSRESSTRAAKAPRLDAPEQQLMHVSHSGGSVMQVLEAEHEDEPNSTFFEEDEVDNLEMYDGQLDGFDYTESLEVEPDRWILRWMR